MATKALLEEEILRKLLQFRPREEEFDLRDTL